MASSSWCRNAHPRVANRRYCIMSIHRSYYDTVEVLFAPSIIVGCYLLFLATTTMTVTNFPRTGTQWDIWIFFFFGGRPVGTNEKITLKVARQYETFFFFFNFPSIFRVVVSDDSYRWWWSLCKPENLTISSILTAPDVSYVCPCNFCSLSGYVKTPEKL